jgi:ABC-type phosphate transport system ATPase subunit
MGISALKGVTVNIKGIVTSLIGPSGCGKPRRAASIGSTSGMAM